MTLKTTKIISKTLEALAWTAVPQIMATIKVDPKEKYPETAGVVTFIGVTALTVASVIYSTSIYDKIAHKTYSNQNKNIIVKIDDNKNIRAMGLYQVSCVSPLLRLALINAEENTTRIKNGYVDLEIKNPKIILFEKDNGFSINKENYYNSEIKINSGMSNSGHTYSPNEVKIVGNKYEHSKQNISKLKEKALNNGSISTVVELENDLNKLQNDYEFKRSELKNAQINVEKELTTIVDQLNIEYFAYKNAPKDTAIPGRDYNLSDIKKQN